MHPQVKKTLFVYRTDTALCRKVHAKPLTLRNILVTGISKPMLQSDFYFTMKDLQFVPYLSSKEMPVTDQLMFGLTRARGEMPKRVASIPNPWLDTKLGDGSARMFQRNAGMAHSARRRIVGFHLLLQKELIFPEDEDKINIIRVAGEFYFFDIYGIAKPNVESIFKCNIPRGIPT